jgi:hypothetical protein
MTAVALLAEPELAERVSLSSRGLSHLRSISIKQRVVPDAQLYFYNATKDDVMVPIGMLLNISQKTSR